MMGNRRTSVKHGLTEGLGLRESPNCFCRASSFGQRWHHGVPIASSFLCFADITIALLLSRLLIVVCDAVANAAFVSGLLVSLAPLV